MTIVVTICEKPDGDIMVHIAEKAALTTDRESRYATAISAEIKRNLAERMPAIVRRILQDEKGQSEN